MEIFKYTIHLQVTVEGPDTDWREVADATATRVTGAKIKGGHVLVRADVDTPNPMPTDPPADFMVYENERS